MVLVCVLAPVGSSAAALSELPKRTEFGGSGSGAGQAVRPRGVALDEATGDVYVVDQGNQRVDEFEPWGQFILSFGKEVDETEVDAGKAAQANVCTAESKDICKAGVEGNGAGQFEVPQGIAVDNSPDSSKGDLYVVDLGNKRIEKFDSKGEFILAFGKEVNETTKADVCTQIEVESGDTCGAGKEGTGEDEFNWPAVGGSFIAVGPTTGTVYVGDENRVQEFNPTGVHEGEVKLAGVGQIQALAADTSGNLYVAVPGTNTVRKYSATGEKLLEFVDPSGEFEVETVSVNSAGDLYTGDEFAENLEYHVLEYGPTGEPLAKSVTFNEEDEVRSTGIAASAHGTVYLPNTLNGPILMFGEFPEIGECPFCKPSVDVEAVSDLGVTSAVLSAQINPDFLPTHYYVQYAEAAAYEAAIAKGAVNPYETGGVLPAPPATVALGGGETGADQPAGVTLQGLSPGRAYDYRFVAESKNSGPIYGENESFTTFPTGIFAGLPDERVYEQVSEEQKNGNEAGIQLSSRTAQPGYGVASADGERFAYYQEGPSGETSSGTDFYSVSSRNPVMGWAAAAALPPGYGPNAANFLSELPHSLLASADLTHFVFRAEGSFVKENPITENLQGSTGLYRSDGDSVEPEWLTEPAEWQSTEHHPPFEVKPEPGASKLGLTNTLRNWSPTGGSPTLNVVYFPYLGTLVKEDASRAPNLVTNANGTEAGPEGFYEYKEGVLRSAAQLPSGAPDAPYSPYGALPAALGTNNEKTSVFHMLDNVVSRDGAKAFFLSPDPVEAPAGGGTTFAQEAGTPTELYVRETTGHGAGEAHRPVLVSRDELNGGAEAEKGAGTGKAAYAETAVAPTLTTSASGAKTVSYAYGAPDGSRVFFQSRDKLSKSAPLAGEKEPEGAGPWTYEFNLETERLTYLPGVAGNILASSEHGSSFIFENSTAGKLELWSGGPAPLEVAGFAKPAGATFEALAANDGAAFVFATNAVLTNAMNAEGTAPANNTGEEQQVYRYEPSSGSVLCVSCAPAGATQSPTTSSPTGRVIADEGGLMFFTTAEKLLSRDTNGLEDVYEWEQEGLGSCPPGHGAGCLYLISSGRSPDPSFYLDSSESGGDVFFATSQGLLAGDSDESYDVYDARVDGGFPQPSLPGECSSDCQPSPSPFSPPAPLTTMPGLSGNLVPPPAESNEPTIKPRIVKPLTRAQKLAKALKACGKDKSKRRRAMCRAKARKRYGRAVSKAKRAVSKGRNG